MIPRRLVGRGCQLLLAAGLSLVAVLQAHAQTVPAGKNPDAAETAAPDANDAEAKNADAKDADVENLQLDWSLLNVDASTLITTPSKARPATQSAAGADMSWSSKDKSNGAAAVSVKQSLSAFLDARVGADMTVVNQPQTLTSSDLLRQKFASDAQPSQSTGSAWAAITAPGLGSIWDKTAVEAAFRARSAKPRSAPRTRALPRDSSAAGSRWCNLRVRLIPGESSIIAAYWPRCGQNQQSRWGPVKFIVRG